MTEQTTTDVVADVITNSHIEKITFPDRKSDHLEDQSTDDERAVLEAMLDKEEQGRLKHMFPRDKVHWRAYGAALVGGFAIMPIIALALTIAFYLVSPGAQGWISVLGGLGVTCAVWLLLALPMRHLTARDRVNSHSYGMLISRLSQLETRLQVIQATKKTFAHYQLIALEEAYGNLQELDAMLYESTSRLPWVLGLGYVVAWFKLHRAEEALIEAEPVEVVVRGAYHDHLAITNSTISNCDDLLDKLHEAVEILDPAMGQVICSHTPMADVAEGLRNITNQLKEVGAHVQQVSQQITNQDNHQHASPAHEDREHASGAPSDEANARLTIREIRRTLNEFRDSNWDSLIRARNRLMGGIFITGIATYVLLSVTLLAASSASGGDLSARSPILAAAAYYIVGAIAGLFSTIYREATGSDPKVADNDDYGLTLARLIGTPLLSGLAGIAGALLYSTAVIQVAQSTQLTLPAIFTLNRLDYLIAAALAGYAPSIIVQGLQQRSNKYISALQNSKASDGTTSN